MDSNKAKELKAGDRLMFRHPRSGNVKFANVTRLHSDGLVIFRWDDGEMGDLPFDEMDFFELSPYADGLGATVVNLLGG